MSPPLWNCRRNSSSLRAAWGRRSCSTMTAGGSRRWCSRRARPPRMSPWWRARDIPVVGRVKDVLAKVEAGDLVIVDGDEAVVLLRPGEDIQQAVSARID